MLTTKQISDLIKQSMIGGHAGLAEALRRNGSPSYSQKTLIKDYSAVSAERRQQYQHPAAGPLPQRRPGPLTPAELAWLERVFPSDVDPAKVSMSDAQALAAIDAGISRMDHPADARLVSAVYSPIREFHDVEAAKVEMENARRPVPSIPASALNAMIDAVTADDPTLTADEAVFRASALVNETADALHQSRAAALDAARSQLDQVEAQPAARTAAPGTVSVGAAASRAWASS